MSIAAEETAPNERSPDRSLDRSLVTGMAWTAIAKWAAQIVSWAATLFAARLLSPSDYGLVAMATLPIGLARMVEDFGLDSVLLQNRNLQAHEQSRLAGLALLIGCTSAVLFIALAVPVARFFAEPQVAALVMALSLLFIFDALQIVPKAGLQRRLDFRRLALAGLIQSVVASTALVVSARSNLGHWSLVVNSLTAATVTTIVLMFWFRYQIRWPSQIRTLAPHLKQGWRMLMSRAAWYAYSNADQTIIGKLLGKSYLGTYSFATTFANLPIQEITSTVTKVVPGIFTQVQDRKDALLRYFLLLNEFIAYLALPAAVGVALTADIAMAVILGPQWDAVVEPLRILCLYSAFYASQSLMSHVLTWTGQFRAVMWCAMVTAAMLPVGLYFAAPYGLGAIAWAWAILYPISNLPQLVLCFRTLGIGPLPWLKSMMPAFVGCLGMAIAVVAVRATLGEHLSHYVRFFAQVGVGAVTYAAIIWFGFRHRVLAIIDMIRHSGSRASAPSPAPAM